MMKDLALDLLDLKLDLVFDAQSFRRMDVSAGKMTIH
jgi:hypothetical protein